MASLEGNGGQLIIHRANGRFDEKLNLGLTPRLRDELARLQVESKFTQSEVIRTTLVAARTDSQASKELSKIVYLTT